MRLCERNQMPKPCGPICMEMCEVWNSEGCLFSVSKRGHFCEHCWTHSIPASAIDGDACPVCGVSEFLNDPDPRFDVEVWSGGSGVRWTAEAVSPHG
jgi:hypothetical protein